MTALPISQARATLPDVIDRVERGDDVTITRHGKPVAVVVRPDKLRDRARAAHETEGARIFRMMEESRNKPLYRGKGISAEFAEELVAWVREGRDARP